MSAVSLKLAVFLCLYWTPLTNAGATGVEWREPGQSITIQCRAPSGQDSLDLKKGVDQEVSVFFKDKMSPKQIVAKDFTKRLQTIGTFPNIDILIKDLTLNDTAPYWCEYNSFDSTTLTSKTTRGKGSVLLVVQEPAVKTAPADAVHSCDPSQQDLVLVSVAISAAVLILIVLVFLIWIIHKKRSQRSDKPRRVTSNDVYEDMRGTHRR